MTDGGPALAAMLAELVRDVPDFPEPGIVFKDISPLLADHDGFRAALDGLAAVGRDESGRSQVDKVVGIESRGFILAAPVALSLGAGFVPVRKAGKLPGPTFQLGYELEYGEAILEVQRDALRPGERVLVIDDVLATGGTMAATHALLEQCGAQVVGTAVLIELGFLTGRDKLVGRRLHALMTV